MLNALERLAGSYGSECTRLRQDLAIAESQRRDYQARVGRPFVHERYMAELTGLRDQLKAGLSATAHEPSENEGPSVFELADRIKTLKAANTIEATPQRIRQKQATAEEPVTARIRRRSETRATEPEVDFDDSPKAGELQSSLAWHLSAKPPPMFQERLATQRLDNGPEVER